MFRNLRSHLKFILVQKTVQNDHVDDFLHQIFYDKFFWQKKTLLRQKTF